MKGVLGSVSTANSFPTRSSLNAEFISESMEKQKSSGLSGWREEPTRQTCGPRRSREEPAFPDHSESPVPLTSAGLRSKLLLPGELEVSGAEEGGERGSLGRRGDRASLSLVEGSITSLYRGISCRWMSEPYSLVKRDGYYLGCGVEDDKGPAIIALWAVKYFIDNNIKLNHKVRFIFGSNEESGMGAVKKYVAENPQPDFMMTPDAEFPIICGEKGIVHGQVDFKFPSDSLKIGRAHV